MRKRYNKDLRTIKEGWGGNPIDEDGRYRNLDFELPSGFKDVFKWKVLHKNKYASQRKGQKTNVEVVKNKLFLRKKSDGITWLGHASFLINIGGKRILTDPVLYDIWPLKRFTPLPCEVENIVDVDYILLSHNHRDHADRKSLKKLTSINPKAIILTSLELAKLLRKWNITNKIIEAGWYQEYPDFGDGLSITFLPAKHWCRRYLHDLNEMLWGSFIIEHENQTIYFGGDSGLGDHFREIGNMFAIDIAILGIGAYEPIWFMHPSHTSPEDARKAFRMLKAKTMIPMHYGTFDLSDEPIFNPKNVLVDLAISDARICIPNIGEVHTF